MSNRFLTYRYNTQLGELKTMALKTKQMSETKRRLLGLAEHEAKEAEKKEDEVVAEEEAEKEEDEVKEEEKPEDSEELPVEKEEKEEEGEEEVKEEDHEEPDGDECQVKEEGDEEEKKEEEEADDDPEKEFDINDESDVFLDDEDEDEKLKEEEEEDAKEKEEVKEEEDGEEEKEEDEVKKEEKDEDDEEDPKKPDIDVEEDVKALFNGEELSDAFKSKAKLVVEAAVRRKVVQFAKTLKSRYNKKLRKAKKAVHESLVEKVDNYLDYVVEEWMDENKIAVQHGLRTEITEEFIDDLRNLFEAHNIMIPKGKENLVESQAKTIEQLKKDIDTEVKRGLSLKKKLNESKKNEIFRSICEGLADTEIEKLKALAVSINYDESYKDKLLVIKESYFPQKTVTSAASSVDKVIDAEKTEEKSNNKSETPISSMDVYRKVLSRLN